MKAKAIVIFASSSQSGNTAQLLASVSKLIELEIVNLKNYEISPFDYEHKNKDDDYLELINKMLSFEKIIFACPVYWYTMPAQMKVFFDRFSDILSIEKDLGRELRGKTAYVLSTGYDPKPKRSFEEVFRNSFKYLGMTYASMLYIGCPEGFAKTNSKAQIQSFSDEILS